jgi:hypothetical protein
MGLAPKGSRNTSRSAAAGVWGLCSIARSKWGVLGSAALPAVRPDFAVSTRSSIGRTSFPFRILCLIAPIMYGFTGLAVINADMPGVLDHYAPSVCHPVIVLAWITRGAR